MGKVRDIIFRSIYIYLISDRLSNIGTLVSNVGGFTICVAIAICGSI